MDLEPDYGTKVCGVCGAKALGCNFQAVTCESCKAFFRRNALRSQESKCHFGDHCIISPLTRRFCQSCRLKKCFSIGMKKDSILTEEQKNAKRVKKRENQRKRSKLSSPTREGQKLDTLFESKSNSTTETFSPQSMSSLSDLASRSPLDVHSISPANALRTIIEGLFTSEASEAITDFPATVKSLVSNELNTLIPSPTASHDKSNFSPLSYARTCLSSKSTQTKTRPTLKQTVNDKSLHRIVEAEFALVPIRSPPDMGSTEPTRLNILERTKLDELVDANEVLKLPLSSVSAPDLINPSLLDIVKMTDDAIRRLLKMSKKLTGFKNLCQEDQIALLKGGCTELMILRSVMSYNPQEDCWQDSKCKMVLKLDVLKQAKGNIYEEHKKFITSFDTFWRSDENVMLLLSAITLFTPERAQIIHHEVVKFEQQTYMFLLKRYLETIFDSSCEALSHYSRLVSKIEELHQLNDNHVRLYLDINPGDTWPLLVEIFDFKH